MSVETLLKVLHSKDIRPRMHDGVPVCTEEECPSYDGKRCRVFGFRPDRICEPATREAFALWGHAQPDQNTDGCGGCGGPSMQWTDISRPPDDKCVWLWSAIDQMWEFSCRKER